MFLSATCPCSNSHTEVLKKLKKDFPKVQFLGIHSNVDESVATGKMYFREAQLNFPVIRDTDSVYAKRLGALKTPHAFIFNGSGELIYRGAATNTSMGTRSSQNYIREVLELDKKGVTPKITERKTLGCYIALKEQ